MLHAISVNIQRRHLMMMAGDRQLPPILKYFIIIISFSKKYISFLGFICIFTNNFYTFKYI